MDSFEAAEIKSNLHAGMQAAFLILISRELLHFYHSKGCFPEIFLAKVLGNISHLIKWVFRKLKKNYIRIEGVMLTFTFPITCITTFSLLIYSFLSIFLTMNDTVFVYIFYIPMWLSISRFFSYNFVKQGNITNIDHFFLLLKTKL